MNDIDQSALIKILAKHYHSWRPKTYFPRTISISR